MKARLLIVGGLFSLLLVSCSVMDVAQSSNSYRTAFINDHFSYDYPAFEQEDVELFDWMYCPNAFNNDEYYQQLDLKWLDPTSEYFNFEEIDNSELLTYINELLVDEEEETQLMEWMINFEPKVVKVLIGE